MVPVGYRPGLFHVIKEYAPLRHKDFFFCLCHPADPIQQQFLPSHQGVFNYMRDGEELVLEPFQRLIQERQLMAYEHNGFYAAMDTFKDKQLLDDLYARGDAPWEVWKCAPPKGITVEPEPWKNSVPDSAGYVRQVAHV